MNPVYFQHIDVTNESTFLKVVKLLFIDDTDPDMILYHFDDETKCNKMFIADPTVSDGKISQYVYVQLQSIHKAWTCKKKEIKAQVRQATTATGEVVEIPDLHMTRHDGGIIEDSIKYEFIPPKNLISNFKGEDLQPYCLSFIKDAINNGNYKDVDFFILSAIPNDYIPNSLKDAYERGITLNSEDNIKEDILEESGNIPVVETVVAEPKVVKETKFAQPVDLQSNIPFMNSMDIRIDDTDTRYITYRDGMYAGICIDNEWHSMKEIIGIVEQKFAEDKNPIPKAQPVAQKIIPKNQTTDFLNNMIQAATKKEATANVEITLEVPPFEVYKLLKTAYPEDWAKIFIDILATSVPVDALQDALAAGLEGYYNAEIDNGTCKK